MFAPEQLFDLGSFEHQKIFEGCTHVWEALHRLNTYLLSLPFEASAIPKGVHLVHPDKIFLGKDSVVEPGAYIEGPCVIGKGCVIRHGAYLRGNVLIGDHCVIGHGTEVKHSILLNGACAPHFNYVGDSILGNRVNLGAGAKCANVRFDKGPIRVLEMDTGRKKLGALIGDGAQVGCNCVLNPGTILGKEVLCFPCLNVRGSIPAYSKVRPATQTIVETK